jgi:predicted DNA binding CopG/RHH family protein
VRPVHYFSDEQLARGRKMKPEQILQFLEDFRELHGGREVPVKRRSTLISLRVPVGLLRAFRFRADAEGVPYQAQIKRLMEQWLLG